MAGSRTSKVQRFILRNSQSGGLDPLVRSRLSALPDVTVIDESPRMVLLDAPPGVLEAALANVPGWEIVPERFTPLPDTRPRVKRPL